MVRPTIGIVGLGYVGLPLAVYFSEHYKTIGIDLNEKKISELKNNYDRMDEVTTEELEAAKVEYTSDEKKIGEAEVIIVAVPTPIDKNNQPDLTLVKKATETVGKNMKKGSTVVFESTVYPGVTEDICVPILEQTSGLQYNKEFYVGYSPERVNPGDKEHTIDKIVKVVSGSNQETAKKLTKIYGDVVTAGIHTAPTIKVAEAAKVIENVQRDLNIALVNELAILFEKLNINIHDVLDAAATKWNFHKYTPGLVGGHCIGVDPYYLTYKAQEVGHHPELILAGRRMNDSLHKYYAKKLVKTLNKAGIPTSKATIVVFGLTFKENCSDYRNTRSKQLIEELNEYGATVYGVDPWLEDNIIEELGAKPLKLADIVPGSIHGGIITVPHIEFSNVDFSHIPAIIDIKGQLNL